MALGLLLLIGLGTLIFWLYRLNKDYYVLAFFAKRVRTKDGRPVESIAPLSKGNTIFGNSFDLYGMDDVQVFDEVHDRAKQLGCSYLEYVMGTSVYNVVDAENFEAIVNDKELLTKGIVYDFMQPALRLGLLTSSGQKWHSRRKLLTPTFHFNILEQFNDVFKAESLKFVQRFEGNAETTISLSELIPRFTLNSICETAMGIKLDDMAAKGDRYRENFGMIEKRFIKRAGNPFFWNNTIYNLFGPSDEKKFLKEIHDFSSEIIAKRRELFAQEIKDKKGCDLEEEDIYIKKKQRFAMLDTLIMAEKDGLIDHEGICEQVDTLMFAGFDTTSIAIIFGLMNMGIYQKQQELCYQEICEHIADDFSNLDVNQLSKLKYLECFIKETMRLYPSAPSISRQTTKDTELANGLILPANAQIVLNMYELHRNPKYWNSPEEFQPERFLPENSKDRHTYAYMPFSAGQRNCIGQKYAMLEIKTFMTVIIKRFKIMPVFDPKDLRLSLGITLGFKNNITVKLIKRNA
ncbi:PREDICTED: cytochrome P450 4p1-like [Drosophila arizonae]|uniref:Cytochrome P450 4p1-like n=1 Tax=Drosophila arizonae TaxID=7263 RepID=A0ABM1PL08_DROAR|nr:PREDICTED: cytochrome P450 4p1-like [Drosophila arizonae]